MMVWIEIIGGFDVFVVMDCDEVFVIKVEM